MSNRVGWKDGWMKVGRGGEDEDKEEEGGGGEREGKSGGGNGGGSGSGLSPLSAGCTVLYCTVLTVWSSVVSVVRVKVV